MCPDPQETEDLVTCAEKTSFFAQCIELGTTMTY